MCFYDGFDETADTIFPDMLSETKEIEDYILEHFVGRIRAVYGIKSDVEKKLAKDIKKCQNAGSVFTYKVFTNVGNAGLVGEHTDQFAKEVKIVHAFSHTKQGQQSCNG